MRWAWLLLMVIGCNKPDWEKATPKIPEPVAQPEPPRGPEKSGPDRIQLQHILISFKTVNVPGLSSTRSLEEAGKFAHELLERARKGEDFDDLVKEHSEAQDFPGVYSLCNRGVEPKEEKKREEMIPAFGDVGFALQIGEIGLAEYDRAKSPYGWHLIKRLK